MRPFTSVRRSGPAGVRAGAPIRCKTPARPPRPAEDPAPARAGVVAFSTSGDAELGTYDEKPTIIFKAARPPEPFEEA